MARGPAPHFEASAKESVRVEAAFLEVAVLALQRSQSVFPAETFMPEMINLSAATTQPYQRQGRGAGPPSGCC
ncbi:unnamed protein product [Phaeothamnion confervicola]